MARNYFPTKEVETRTSTTTQSQSNTGARDVSESTVSNTTGSNVTARDLTSTSTGQDVQTVKADIGALVSFKIPIRVKMGTVPDGGIIPPQQPT